MNFFKTSEDITHSARPLARNTLITSIAVGIAATAILLSGSFSAYAETKGLEKEELKFGFIKLTDMAPLAIAYEKGYFEDEGLYVTIEAQATGKYYLMALSTANLTAHTCWLVNL